MYAFRRAVELGCGALEMDVHCTRDGFLIVSHDETVDRTTAATGAIAALSLEELLEIDNAHWFVPGHDVVTGLPEDRYPHRGRFHGGDPSFGFTRIEQVLDEFPDVYLNFDLKETSPSVVPYEAKLAEVLRSYKRTDDVIVASFHEHALDEFRRIAPELPTALGPDDTLAFGVALVDGGPMPALPTSAVALQVPTTYGDHRIVDEAFVHGAHAHGLAVHVWTIDEPEEMRELLALGVDGIISDVPSVLLRTMIDAGYR
jgi:glycerophosphoryl diester phosphodiesterase